MEFSIQETGHGPAILGHIGSVEDVIVARLPKEMTDRRYDARDFRFGFELATPKNLSSIGEAMIANDFCYANSTDESSKDYGRTIYGHEFISGGVFLIPKKAEPSHKVSIQKPISLIDFYNKLNGRLKRPSAFIGLFHFSDFHATAIGKPPVDGRNIFENKADYYPHPPIKKKNVWGFIMGAMTDFEGFEDINEQLKAVLYKNPMDAKSTLVHHAHVLTLKKKVDRFEDVVPSIVDQVLHLFIDGTVIDQGHAAIYTVGGVENYLMKGKIHHERG